MCIFHIIQPCFTNTSGKTHKTAEARMTCCLWQVHIRLLKKGHRKGNFFKSYSYVSFCLSVNDNFWSSFFVHPECCQKNIPVISLAKFWIKPNHRRSGPSNFSRKAYQNLFSYQLVITYCFSKKQNAHNSRKHKSRFCPCIMGTSTESERKSRESLWVTDIFLNLPQLSALAPAQTLLCASQNTPFSHLVHFRLGIFSMCCCSLT